MKQRSRKERFYIEVGDAMFTNNTRCFVDMETLEVDMHDESGLDFGNFEDDDDETEDPLNNPDRYFLIEQLKPWQSFKIMEDFTESVQQKQLQLQLTKALERKRPFANFKNVIDYSTERENWFVFRAERHMEIAKEWLEKNAPAELIEKIKLLPSVFLI